MRPKDARIVLERCAGLLTDCDENLQPLINMMEGRGLDLVDVQTLFKEKENRVLLANSGYKSMTFAKYAFWRYICLSTGISYFFTHQ